jgi:hypothetical protein
MSDPSQAATGRTKGKRAECARGVGFLAHGSPRGRPARSRMTRVVRDCRTFGAARQSRRAFARLPAVPLSSLRTWALGQLATHCQRGLCLLDRVGSISRRAWSRSRMRTERREGEARVGDGTESVARAAAQVGAQPGHTPTGERSAGRNRAGACAAGSRP